MPDPESHFHWLPYESGRGRIAWVVRPNSQKKQADYVRFAVRTAGDKFELYYAPEHGTQSAHLQTFDTLEAAKAYAETIWIMGLADQLWKSARGGD